MDIVDKNRMCHGDEVHASSLPKGYGGELLDLEACGPSNNF